jgi:hypothetical protein
MAQSIIRKRKSTKDEVLQNSLGKRENRGCDDEQKIFDIQT